MPIVNYIREHEWFIEYAADEGLTPNDVSLYDAILYFVNRKAEGNDWPDDFIRIRNDRLLPFCHMGFDAMARSRNKLKQKGVIDFLNGDRNKEAPAYKIIYRYPERSFSQDEGFCPLKTDNNADKSTDKTADKNADKSTDKTADKSADIIPNYTENDIRNPNGIISHTDFSETGNRARGRLSETYIDSAGLKQKCRFDGAFLTSDRARMAVVQRILDKFDGDMDSENAHFKLAAFLHDGMPPEILDDEIERFRSLRKFVAAMAGIFYDRGYEEKRDAVEMRRCMEMAGGNRRLADSYYRRSGRFAPEEKEAAEG
jgi:hypothetical protein